MDLEDDFSEHDDTLSDADDDAPAAEPEPEEPQGPTEEDLGALEELDAEIAALSADGYFREALDTMVSALEACFSIHGPGSEPLKKRRASTVRFALGLAHRYISAGEVEDAHALMFEAENLAANSTDLIIEVITQKGDCFRQAGEYREALLELERAVKMQRPEAAASNGITPDAKRDAETHLILGAVLSQTGHHHDAAREAQRAILLAQQALHDAIAGVDDQSELSAIEKAAAAPKDDVLYYVSVRTGDVKGAGTDANVSITLLGDHGEAGPLPLGSDPLCDFEHDQDDQFEVRRFQAILGNL
jgi:tetratricopeptide (TPR) repeat protein